VSRRSDERP